jgi:hypothetical protein
MFPLLCYFSREVLSDFAILSFSMCCISFVGRVFGNIHCVGSVGCYTCDLGFLRVGKTFLMPTWPYLIEGAPDSALPH